MLQKSARTSKIKIYRFIIKKLYRIISEMLTLRKYFTYNLIQTFYLAHVKYFWTSLEGICIIIDNNYKLLTMFQRVYVYLNEPIKIVELIKLPNQSIH